MPMGTAYICDIPSCAAQVRSDLHSDKYAEALLRDDEAEIVRIIGAQVADAKAKAAAAGFLINEELRIVRCAAHQADLAEDA